MFINLHNGDKIKNYVASAFGIPFVLCIIMHGEFLYVYIFIISFSLKMIYYVRNILLWDYVTNNNNNKVITLIIIIIIIIIIITATITITTTNTTTTTKTAIDCN